MQERRQVEGTHRLNDEVVTERTTYTILVLHVSLFEAKNFGLDRQWLAGWQWIWNHIDVTLDASDKLRAARKLVERIERDWAHVDFCTGQLSLNPSLN